MNTFTETETIHTYIDDLTKIQLLLSMIDKINNLITYVIIIFHA